MTNLGRADFIDSTFILSGQINGSYNVTIADLLDASTDLFDVSNPPMSIVMSAAFSKGMNNLYIPSGPYMADSIVPVGESSADEDISDIKNYHVTIRKGATAVVEVIGSHEDDDGKIMEYTEEEIPVVLSETMKFRSTKKSVFNKDYSNSDDCAALNFIASAIWTTNIKSDLELYMTAYPERHTFALGLQSLMNSIPALEELNPISRAAFLSLPKATNLMVYAKPGIELKVKYPNTHATIYSPSVTNDYAKIGGMTAICGAQAVDIAKINQKAIDNVRIEYAMALGAYNTIATTASFSGLPLIAALHLNPQMITDAMEQLEDHPRLRVMEAEGYKLSVNYDFFTASENPHVLKAAKMMAETTARTSNIYRAITASLGTKAAINVDSSFTDQIPKEFRQKAEAVNIPMDVRIAMATVCIGLGKGCAPTATNLLKRGRNSFSEYLKTFAGMLIPDDIKRMKDSREAIAIYYICKEKDIHTAIHDCTGKMPIKAASIVKKLNQLAGAEEGNIALQNGKIILWALRRMNSYEPTLIGSLLMHLSSIQRTVNVSAKSFTNWNVTKGLGGPEMASKEWYSNGIDFLFGLPKFNMGYDYFHINVLKKAMRVANLNDEREELFNFKTKNDTFDRFKEAEEQAQKDFEEDHGVFPEREPMEQDEDEEDDESGGINPENWPGRGVICDFENDEAGRRIESDLVDEAGFAGDTEIEGILKDLEESGKRDDEYHELGRKAVIAVCKSTDVSPQRRWRVKKKDEEGDDDCFAAGHNEDNVTEIWSMDGKGFMNPNFRSPFYSFEQLADITGKSPDVLRSFPKENLGLMKFHIRGRLNNLAVKSVGMPPWEECTEMQKKESIKCQLIMKYKLQWLKEKSCRPRDVMTFAMGAALRHIKKFANSEAYNFAALKHMFAMTILNDNYRAASSSVSHVYRYLNVKEFHSLYNIIRFLQQEINWTFNDIEQMKESLEKEPFKEGIRKAAAAYIKPKRKFPDLLLKTSAFTKSEYIPVKCFVRGRGDGEDSEVCSEDEALFEIPDMQNDENNLKENIKRTLNKAFVAEFGFESFYKELMDKSDPGVIEYLWNTHVERILAAKDLEPKDNINNESFME
eukprot:GHVU01166058.1.p1 GENE.GHVU01166058.1~~GHVU01166058.1.p1  ORF type:complete len:1097 (-),score=237.01 GHVU01166058.1:51-3341(-)